MRWLRKADETVEKNGGVLQNQEAVKDVYVRWDNKPWSD